jgi:hypothetical protein
MAIVQDRVAVALIGLSRNGRLRQGWWLCLMPVDWLCLSVAAWRALGSWCSNRTIGRRPSTAPPRGRKRPTMKFRSNAAQK